MTELIHKSIIIFERKKIKLIYIQNKPKATCMDDKFITNYTNQ